MTPRIVDTPLCTIIEVNSGACNFLQLANEYPYERTWISWEWEYEGGGDVICLPFCYIDILGKFSEIQLAMFPKLVEEVRLDSYEHAMYKNYMYLKNDNALNKVVAFADAKRSFKSLLNANGFSPSNALVIVKRPWDGKLYPQEMDALKIANQHVGHLTNEQKVKKLGEELVELAMALQEGDDQHILEELVDCAYILLHIKDRIAPDRSLLSLIEDAKNKMVQRFSKGSDYKLK